MEHTIISDQRLSCVSKPFDSTPLCSHIPCNTPPYYHTPCNLAGVRSYALVIKNTANTPPRYHTPMSSGRVCSHSIATDAPLSHTPSCGAPVHGAHHRGYARYHPPPPKKAPSVMVCSNVNKIITGVWSHPGDNGSPTVGHPQGALTAPSFCHFENSTLKIQHQYEYLRVEGEP